MRARVHRTLETLLVDTCLWVAAAAAGLTAYAGQALGLPFRAGPPGVAFAATVLIYGADQRLDGGGEESPPPGATRRARRLIQPAAAGALAAQLAAAPFAVMVVVLSGGLPCLLYNRPVRGARLRDLPGAKPLFVTAALAVAAVSVPLAWTSAPLPGVGRILWVAAALFAVVLCNVCFFDVRDRATDARRGVRTVPVRFGVRGTRLFCLATCGSMGLALVVRQLTGAAADPGLVAATVATAVYAAWLPSTASRLGYALAVDGIPVLLGVSVLCGGG